MLWKLIKLKKLDYFFPFHVFLNINDVYRHFRIAYIDFN